MSIYSLCDLIQLSKNYTMVVYYKSLNNTAQSKAFYQQTEQKIYKLKG